MQKTSFYIHTNIVTKKWGEKERETRFPETHEWFEQKWWEKNRRKKWEISFFIFTRTSWPKNWGKKTREIIFPKTHEWFKQKCWENIVAKRCEKTFFIFTQISWRKNRGKNARNNFYRNTRMVRAKMLGKKSSPKSAKNVFLYSQEYRDQKSGGKKRAK